ncbi:UPF0058 family protein [Halegenticoccus tardaugens]|uniref:UPF0058 family protein n=1 Tax=Halegenticoccus tardaugens TaxID=2071624 RepID=UPI00100AEC87|nr:UPF0058 family protein [Halegenticoccus tardaugens]
MKKNELVHLHALLATIAEDYVERGVAAREDFEPYRELGITPMTLTASRDRHEEAVMALLRVLAARSAGEPTARPELVEG